MTRRGTSAPSDRGPRLLFLGHGAERTGPPIWLGHLLAWLDGNTDARAQVAVARDGPLLVDYRRHAAVLVASHHAEPAEPLAAALRRVGQEDLARTASQRWLQRRLRRVGHHDLVYVNTASPATVRMLEYLPEPPGSVPVVTHVHELEIGLRHNLAPAELACCSTAATTWWLRPKPWPRT